MHALIHDRFGEPADVIEDREIPLRQPGAGEVRLRVLRSPIHNHDLATIRGTYGYKPELPAIAGSEFVGEVEALGQGVDQLQIGSRLAVATRGAWADYVCVPAAMAVPVPASIPDDVAAQLLAMPLSAVVLVHELRVKAGDWIAQNAAGGAVGRIVMQLAQSQGINIVNLVRSERAAEELRSFGAQHVIVTTEEGWSQRARALTGGKGFSRIVDSVAGSEALELQRLLAQYGELVIFGGLSGAPIKLDPSLMISLECTVRGFWMSSWMMRASHDDRNQAMRTVFELALANKLPLPVEGVFPFADAKRALVAAQTPGRSGKVLLRP